MARESTGAYSCLIVGNYVLRGTAQHTGAFSTDDQPVMHWVFSAPSFVLRTGYQTGPREREREGLTDTHRLTKTDDCLHFFVFCLFSSFVLHPGAELSCVSDTECAHHFFFIGSSSNWCVCVHFECVRVCVPCENDLAVGNENRCLAIHIVT